MKKGLVGFGIMGLAFGLTIACGSFSSSDEPAAVPEEAATVDGPGLVDATVPPDAQAPDARPSRCATFDAAAAVQPTGDVSAYPCGKDLVALLGDPLHCGWCGHACLDGASCQNGRCAALPLVTGPPNGFLGLSRVDDTDIYWVDLNRTPSAIFRAPNTQVTNESDANKLAEVDVNEPANKQTYGVAIDDRLYVHTYSRLLQAPLDGGALSPFSPVSAGNDFTPLVASGAHLYQTSVEGAGTFIDFSKADGAVLSKQTSISGAKDLAATPDGRYAFIIGRTAVDAGIVDGSAATRGALYRYTVANRSLTRVTVFEAMGATGSALVADDDFVYFPEGLAGSILRLAVDAPIGTAPTVLSKGDGRRVSNLALDDGRVYWLSSNVPPNYYWDLSSVDKCGGGDFRHLAASDFLVFSPQGLVAHGKYLYTTSRDLIYRVAK